MTNLKHVLEHPGLDSAEIGILELHTVGEMVTNRGNIMIELHKNLTTRGDVMGNNQHRIVDLTMYM